MPKKAKISDKTKSKLATLLEKYVEGVIELQIEINRRYKEGRKGKLFEDLDLALGSAFGKIEKHNQRPVTKEGQKVLREAVNLILEKTGTSARISFQHALNVVKEELGNEFLCNAKSTKSFYIVIDKSLKRLGENVKQDMLYIFPIIYTLDASSISIKFGPLEFSDIVQLREEILSNDFSSSNSENSPFEQKYKEAWGEVFKRVKYVLKVHVQGYELDKGEIAARRAVEFFLNILRLSFKWDNHPRIKVLEQNIESKYMPSLVFINGEDPRRSLSGARSEYLPVKDGVEVQAVNFLSDFSGLLSAILDGMVNNSASRSIILQKIEYASFLIMTAFQQKSVRITLFNFVAALETLACLGDDSSKKEGLVMRCSNVVLGLSKSEQEEIGRAIRSAYQARNSVVHGDAFEEDKHWKPFRDLEKWMLSLVLSFVNLLTHVQITHNPKSGKILRKLVRDHFESSR